MAVIGYVLLSFALILTRAKCQLSENTPPVMYLDRNWQLQENEKVGSVVTKVHGSDSEDGRLQYGLEPIQFYTTNKRQKQRPLPFKIDENTGVVFLNESLIGRGGEDLHLYVTVSDGKLTAKTEVYANILKSSNASSPYPSYKSSLPPISGLFNLPGFKGLPPSTLANNPPPSITNNPNPLPGRLPANVQKTYEKQSKPSQLNPVTYYKTEVESTTEITMKMDDKIDNEDQTLKSAPNLTVTVIPIVFVVGVFLAVGVVVLVFRKKICLGRVKSGKDDMTKETSGVIILQDDPSLLMQHWNGPRAFSNRYEHWDKETQSQGPQHSELSKQDRWEFPRHRLKFFNILGEGAFGQVWKCEALEIAGTEGLSVVAVKTLKENATEKERSDLISELKVMKSLEAHPNIVRLLGCCTEKEPIFLIMEYISKGKLQSYLRNSRAERYYNNMHGQSKSLTSRDLTSFAYQVAKGMEFLSTKGIVHRDLAARNVLITEDRTCKVADFGFARDIVASHVYERKSEGRLPIRWMAPESLYDNIFSVKSDVWSFGVLIWEIVTLGSTPYPGLSAAEVMRKVRDGYRLDKPEHCRRELYNIMYYCWDKDPKQRPHFTECVELLEKLLMTETDYIELERFPDHSYYNMMSLSGEKL